MKNKRLVASIVEIVLGAVLMGTGFAGLVDEYWNGMGTALLVVGALQLFRQIRYKTNAEYRESVNVEAADERNKYISMKAWSWAGYLFVMIAAVASIALKIAGLDDYVSIASGSVCLIILLYWVSYMILRKKY